MKETNNSLSCLLTVCGLIALIAAIAYGVYYFFFAEDEEDLEDDLLEEAEGTETVSPLPEEQAVPA